MERISPLKEVKWSRTCAKVGVKVFLTEKKSPPKETLTNRILVSEEKVIRYSEINRTVLLSKKGVSVRYTKVKRVVSLKKEKRVSTK